MTECNSVELTCELSIYKNDSDVKKIIKQKEKEGFIIQSIRTDYIDEIATIVFIKYLI